MNRISKSIFFSVLSIMASGNAWASILTPQGAEDYLKRLDNQPMLRERMQMPAGMTPEEEEAMKFLYAYMATPDIIDYTPEYYLENIRLSLQAAREMPWGKDIPEREWRHFVLPVRINNENLDDSRSLFYEELKDRVKGMSMEEAVLEVNHWCHEKVSYQPSDGRTSSPLETVKNALGRCGEESTFTVAALRSVGIPARQVYTPRWAHTDDNHAWVEAWADGKWHFLGACEPEAVLNLAWFNAPAARGMLMTTKVAGRYDGPEEQLETTPITTVINVTENYAPTTLSEVIVTDEEGRPVEDAKVRFCLYNYAEFYPLVVKLTDKEGKATFRSGKGDMVVWATDGRNFNYSKIRAGERLLLSLDKGPEYAGWAEFDLTPPPTGGNMPKVGDAAAALNNRRKQYEDSIRLSYVSTFFTPESAREASVRLGYGEDASEPLVRSRGNYKTVEVFLKSVPDSLRSRAINLLGAVNEKDLHDISVEVLNDHLYKTVGNAESPFYDRYVLNPRIEYEMLRPYKQELRGKVHAGRIAEYKENPGLLVKELEKNIVLDPLYNPGGFRQSACGSLNYGVADSFNRSLAFVALCRSLGIPARIDAVTGATQYADSEGVWQDAAFGAGSAADDSSARKGRFNIKDMNPESGRQPKYYSQFTVSAIKDGAPSLMEFDEYESVDGINDRKELLDEGQYLLVSGQRLADGSVLSRAEIFKVSGGATVDVPLIVRQDTTALQVIGSLDAELLYTPVSRNGNGFKADDARSILSSVGRGYYALGLILPGHEPSAHAINDIAAASMEIAGCSRKVLLLFPNAEAATRFRIEDYGELPDNIIFGIDSDGIAEGLRDGLELATVSPSEMPLFVVADSFNRIVFLRKGYSIHLGETLARILGEVSK